MSKILLTMPKEYLKAVDEAAKSQHRTRSELIREAVRKLYYHPKRTPEQQAKIDEAFKGFEKLRRIWKEPFNSAQEIRKMRDSR